MNLWWYLDHWNTLYVALWNFYSRCTVLYMYVHFNGQRIVLVLYARIFVLIYACWYLLVLYTIYIYIQYISQMYIEEYYHSITFRLPSHNHMGICTQSQTTEICLNVRLKCLYCIKDRVCFQPCCLALYIYPQFTWIELSTHALNTSEKGMWYFFTKQFFASVGSVT